MIRVVADLGNSRLKWGRVGPRGLLSETIALPNDDPEAWESAWGRWAPDGEASTWAISTVNPPQAERLGKFLEGLGAVATTWFRSAADVPIGHDLEYVETAGADRALAVAASIARHTPGVPGLVVSCGSAITVERIDAGGVWQGGAIAPGLGLSARALHLLTAQLPLVIPAPAPSPWGRSTRPALEAGVYWGVVGAVRELLTRQASGLLPPPWILWTGGDAPDLAAAIHGQEARIVPDLVLEGLIRLGFRQGLPDVPR